MNGQELFEGLATEGQQHLSKANQLGALPEEIIEGLENLNHYLPIGRDLGVINMETLQTAHRFLSIDDRKKAERFALQLSQLEQTGPIR